MCRCWRLFFVNGDVNPALREIAALRCTVFERKREYVTFAVLAVITRVFWRRGANGKAQRIVTLKMKMRERDTKSFDLRNL